MSVSTVAANGRTPVSDSRPEFAAWSPEQLEAELRDETDPRQRLLLLLAWDAGLPLVKLQCISTLESLLAQASMWGRSPTIAVDGIEYRISTRTVGAIAEWFMHENCPELLGAREANDRTLAEPGWLIRITDADSYLVGMSDPMTLGEAVALMDRFNDGGAGNFCLVRPRKKGGDE